MESKRFRPQILFILILCAFCIFQSCKNHRHKLRSGIIVDPGATTVFIDSAQAKKYLNDSASRAEFSIPIERFYTDNEFFMAWDSFTNKGGIAEKFITMLETVADDGLNPSDFRIKELKALLSATELSIAKDTAVKNLDIMLTTEFLKYAAQMREGITRNQKKQLGWGLAAITIPIDSLIKLVIADRDKPDPFHVLQPPHPEYYKLRQALKYYRELDKKGGWAALPAFKRLKKGDTSVMVVKLRDRLAASGDYLSASQSHPHPEIFETDLERAVKSFQNEQGIEPDGIVSGKTIAALNVSVKARIREILINMERWRLMPVFPDKYVEVNIPEFRLRVFNEGREYFSMRTIVGKDNKSTPVFNDTFSNIVFNPYWNIPNSITEAEILPEWYKNPLFLEEHHMEAVDGFDTGAHVVPYWKVRWRDINKEGFHYRIRQRPLNDNPLGAIKFMFPNNYNVYLHGTSSPGLFNKAVRMYSHGCIRIEDPLKLAEFLLKDQPEWDHTRISEHMDAGKEDWVKISGTSVFILYFNAWVDGSGRMQFRDDIYDLDTGIGAALGLN